jgi:hypothetical protein
MVKYKQYKWKFIATIILLIGFEFALRYIIQLTPGKIENYANFPSNDKITLLPFYTTDEAGIYKLDKIITDSLKTNIEQNDADYLIKLPLSDNVSEIIIDFIQLTENIADQSFPNQQLSKFELFAKTTLLNESVNAKIIEDYLTFPFNEHGFRSISFCSSMPGKTKVMLVGDSFAWGMSATPIYNSYADLLLAKGYCVYNLGIIGTDPAQYEAVVKKYTPMLQPDIIIVNFFEGNDYMPAPRTPKQNQPLEHFTNIGYINAFPLGEYMNLEESLEFYRHISAIPFVETNKFNWVCSKTVLGTQLWRFLYKIKIIKHPLKRAYFNYNNNPKSEKARFTRPYIQNINNFANENNVPVVFTFIPEKPGYNETIRDFLTNNDQKRAFDIVFENINCYKAPNLMEEDFETDGGSHFVNSGSLKYGVFLDSLITHHLNSDTYN